MFSFFPALPDLSPSGQKYLLCRRIHVVVTGRLRERKGSFSRVLFSLKADESVYAKTGTCGWSGPAGLGLPRRTGSLPGCVGASCPPLTGPHLSVTPRDPPRTERLPTLPELTHADGPVRSPTALSELGSVIPSRGSPRGRPGPVYRWAWGEESAPVTQQTHSVSGRREYFETINKKKVSNASLSKYLEFCGDAC